MTAICSSVRIAMSARAGTSSRGERVANASCRQRHVCGSTAIVPAQAPDNTPWPAGHVDTHTLPVDEANSPLPQDVHTVELEQPTQLAMEVAETTTLQSRHASSAHTDALARCGDASATCDARVCVANRAPAAIANSARCRRIH